MATIVLSPPALLIDSMAARRVPLANIPNAANSPYRGGSATKRPRPKTDDLTDLEDGRSPAKKRQLVEAHNDARRVHHVSVDSRDDRTAATKNIVPPRKLVLAASKRPQLHVAEKQDKQTLHDIENIKKWKEHYMKAFPTMVFFFDGLPQDVCIRFSRQAAALGAVSIIQCSLSSRLMKCPERREVFLEIDHAYCHNTTHPSQPN